MPPHLQQVLRHEWKNNVDTIEHHICCRDSPTGRWRSLVLVPKHIVWTQQKRDILSITGDIIMMAPEEIFGLIGCGLLLLMLTGVTKVDELFGEQIGEQLHDEQQVLVLVLLSRAVAPLPALVVFGVDLQQRQTRFVQLHGLCLEEERGHSSER